MGVNALWISTAPSRNSESWKNVKVLWSDLTKKLLTVMRTGETMAEYDSMKPDQKAEKKDVGGFVGGTINGGRRLKSAISARSMITLDVDFATPEFWTAFTLQYNCAAFLYATHSHRVNKPRYRLIVPLSREVLPDQYEAVARRVAGDLDIEIFDITTFQPSRLMYWPSISKDGVYHTEEQDGAFLDVDSVLARYADWTDSSQWPLSVKVKEIVKRDITKKGDPTAIKGLIGAFCRVYGIKEAIETFLKDVYVPTDKEDRYTYLKGSTAAGLVIYDNNLFAYSNHGTDPITGREVNAFDLVRLHKFGHLDEEYAGKDINKFPSHRAMLDLTIKDEKVSFEQSMSIIKDASDVFKDIPIGELDWIGRLKKDRLGKIECTNQNILIILQNDPNLFGCFAYDQFRNAEVSLRDLPWRNIVRSGDPLIDGDDACLRGYLETNYGISSPPKVKDAFKQLMIENTVNPVKEYLTGLTWDGEKRIDTLLIDYFGAEDSNYTRFTIRKTLVAAVARIMHPGVKFDNVLVLVSEEGKNKSSFLEKIGVKWFSSDFGPLDNISRAMEQVQGAWIIEIAELAAIRKADAETVKHFVSKTEDQFRVAYGERKSYFKRQCIFIGTTNKVDFITESGKNRRFWPVLLSVTEPVKDVWSDLTAGEIRQIWAEAVTLYEREEPLHLNADQEQEAIAAKEKHRERDEQEPMIVKYLEMPLPEDYDNWDTFAQQDYRNDENRWKIEGVAQRSKVSVMQIWCDVFNGTLSNGKTWNVKFIRNIMDKLREWEPRVIKMDGSAHRGYVRRMAPVTSKK
jgi:putative DNA primase/helicase